VEGDEEGAAGAQPADRQATGDRAPGRAPALHREGTEADHSQEAEASRAEATRLRQLPEDAIGPRWAVRLVLAPGVEGRRSLVSRRCGVCKRQFRPDFGTQKWCKPCARKATSEPGEENTMSSTSTELVEHEHFASDMDVITTAALTMFGSDPNNALRRMSEYATALMDVVNDRRLFVVIGGKKYLTHEAFVLLGGLTGVTPVVAWTRPLEDGSGWEARVEARTLDERVIGAAESMCTRAESKWAKRDEFQLRSMSQTRAIARALRGPLSPIVMLSEYEPTAAEEMVDIVVDAKAAGAEARKRDPIPAAIKPTAEQKAELRCLLGDLATANPDVDWTRLAREIAGVPGNMLTATTMDVLLGKLRAELDELEEAP
jgi:hypothetical protein